MPPHSVGDLTRQVTSRLHRLRAQVTGFFLVEGLGRVLLWLLVLIGVDLLIDWAFHMDRAQRAVMLVLILATLFAVLYRRLLRPLGYHLSDDALCLQVEAQHRELGQSFISALQFSRMRDFAEKGVSPALVAATIDDGMHRAAALDFSDVLRKDRFVKNLILVGALVAVLGGVGYAAATTEPLGIWFDRNVLLGNRQWPQQTYLIVEGVEDGKLTIPRGDDWPLTVRVDQSSRQLPDAVWLDIRTSGSRRTEPLEELAAGLTFQTTLKNVTEEFELRARSRNSATAWIPVVLVDRPAVTELELTATPPAYAGGQPEPLAPGKGPYYLLKGSRLDLKGRSNKPLSRAVLVAGNTRIDLPVRDGVAFEGALPPEQLQESVCLIELTDTEQLLLPGRSEKGPLSSKLPARFILKIRPDREPQFQARLEGISAMVVPQARIPLAARVKDDFEIAALRLDHAWRAQESQAGGAAGKIDLAAVEGIGRQLGRTELEFDYAFDIAPLEIPPGSGLSFTLEADDNDDVSGPKTGRSITFILRIVPEEELRNDLLRREKEQRQEFERLLKAQEDLTTETRALRAAVREEASLPTDQRQLLVKLQKQQKLLGTNIAAVAARLQDVVAEIGNNRLEEPEGVLQKRLREQIIGPMFRITDESIPQAADGLDQTRREADRPQQRDAALGATIVTQEQIAQQMREILSHMVKAEGFQEAVNLLYELQKAQRNVYDLTGKSRGGSTLPPEEPESPPQDQP